jgi:Ca2+-transporting ATPase
MVLMPVHILFLQLVIDPACSIVFEAEPLEAGEMRMPPRNPLARLFDRQVLWRGLMQGAGQLAIVLVAYVNAPLGVGCQRGRWRSRCWSCPTLR